MPDRGPLGRTASRRPWREPEARTRRVDSLTRDATLRTLLDAGFELPIIADYLHLSHKQTGNLIRALGYRTAWAGPMYARAFWLVLEERIARLFASGLTPEAIVASLGPPTTIAGVRHLVYNRRHLNLTVSLKQRRATRRQGASS